MKLLIGPPCPDSLAVGQCRNGYRESIVWEDVDGSRRPGHGPSGPGRGPRRPPSRAASRVSGKEKQGPVTQHAPRVAAQGRYVYAVWHEQGDGLANVFMAVSRNHGKTSTSRCG